MSEHSIQTLCLDNLEKHERLPAGALALLRASVERARVVAVLDGWAATGKADRWETLDRRDVAVKWPAMRWRVLLSYADDQCSCYFGPTPDAARAAAAAAIEKGEV